MNLADLSADLNANPTLKKRKIDDVQDLDTYSDAILDIPSDVELLIQHVQSLTANGFEFVFQHQVYAMNSNRTVVDAEVLRLRLILNKYKLLHCTFPAGTKMIQAVAMISTTNYISIVERCLKEQTNNLLRVKFVNWLRQSSQISMLRKDLHPLSDIEIDRLTQLGFLHFRNHVQENEGSAAEDMFWLFCPLLRPLLTTMTRTEKEILAIIRKTKFKEISEKKLVSLCEKTGKNMKGASPFNVKYHVLDMEGRNLIYKVAAPGGDDNILRIK